MLTPELIASFSSLTAEVHYDDGFVLYLNGTRVADSGQISGYPPRFNQSGGPATDPPAVTVDLTSRMDLLVGGTNILAIQGHNARLSGSSDCFVSPILRATLGEAGAGPDAHTRVVINELLVNSDAAAGVDWIELYNPGPALVETGPICSSIKSRMGRPCGRAASGRLFRARAPPTSPSGWTSPAKPFMSRPRPTTLNLRRFACSMRSATRRWSRR
jgi:hypothetical protein